MMVIFCQLQTRRENGENKVKSMDQEGAMSDICRIETANSTTGFERPKVSLMTGNGDMVTPRKSSQLCG